MPSPLFQQLALSQLELLAASLLLLLHADNDTNSGGPTASAAAARVSKIKTAALYLPKENARTGQLEFVPAVLYPNPLEEKRRRRVFIASGDSTDSASAAAAAPTAAAAAALSSQSGTTLTKLLAGFQHANTLLPTYPMVASGTEPGIGAVEEVRVGGGTGGGGGGAGAGTGGGAAGGGGGTAGGAAVSSAEEEESTIATTIVVPSLSVPLFSGSQTVGVLLVSPNDEHESGTSTNARRNDKDEDSGRFWTELDRQQVARAARSLSLALSMDAERAATEALNYRSQAALSDGLHQLKNPLQAMRTYGKLLQRRIADGVDVDVGDGTARRSGGGGMTPQLLELAEHLIAQSDRVADRLKPVDSIVDGMTASAARGRQRLLLSPSASSSTASSSALTTLPPAWGPFDGTTIPSPPRGQGESEGETDSHTSRRSRETGATPSRLDLNRRGSSSSLRRQQQSSDDEENGLKLSPPPPSAQHHLTLLPEQQEEELALEMAFVDDVLEPIVSAFRAIAEDQRIEFVVESPVVPVDELPGVTVCPSALQEAVSNLLDNAFKYVVTGNNTNRRHPRVRLCMKPNEAGEEAGVTILVQDNGPGISAEEREKIFQRGYRSPRTSSSVDGSGIGLDIAKSLVDRMGGRLRVVGENGFVAVSSGENDDGFTTVLELKLFRNPQRKQQESE